MKLFQLRKDKLPKKGQEWAHKDNIATTVKIVAVRDHKTRKSFQMREQEIYYRFTIPPAPDVKHLPLKKFLLSYERVR
jgi:hypothetical protein